MDGKEQRSKLMDFVFLKFSKGSLSSISTGQEYLINRMIQRSYTFFHLDYTIKYDQV